VGGLIFLSNYNVVHDHTVWINKNEYDFEGTFAITKWKFWLYPLYTVVISLSTLVPAVLVLKRLFTKGTNPKLKKIIFWRTFIYLIFYLMFCFEVLHDQLFSNHIKK
jgi:hypothetical protein